MISSKASNGCTVLCELSRSVGVIADRTLLGLFQGPIPDLSTVNPTGANFGLTSDELFSQLGLLEENCLGLVRLPALARQYEYVGQGTAIRIPMSEITEDLIGIKNGTPTFFLLRTLQNSASSATWAKFNEARISVQNAMLGSVSDVAGNGELRILGGEIQAGVRYRLTDLTVHV